MTTERIKVLVLDQLRTEKAKIEGGLHEAITSIDRYMKLSQLSIAISQSESIEEIYLLLTYAQKENITQDRRSLKLTDLSFCEKEFAVQ